MNQIKISHPINEFITFNSGSFTQIVGNNKELKNHIYRSFNWYFSGKKYSENDLSLFQQKELEIRENGVLLSRSDCHLISLQYIGDFIEQMSYKKGSLAYEYLRKISESVDFAMELEKINHSLTKIATLLNQEIDFKNCQFVYGVDNIDLTSQHIISKYLVPTYSFENLSISFEWLNSDLIYHLFFDMLESYLSFKTDKLLLICQGIDAKVSFEHYQEICQQIKRMCQTFPYFKVILFPSNSSYIDMDPKYMESVVVVADGIENFYEADFMYERYKRNYPTNYPMSQNEFLRSLARIGDNLFSSKKITESMAFQDLISLKIINQLYHYSTPKINQIVPSKMELAYLFSSN
ncbi:CRISPR-associated protein Csn2-St [Streptococcus marimammalium]|uniref:CRISPR-associated protein Csn2-St n=1 Tax=Streptococcus marimammalium TaxID=269666 RepID=UPI00036679F9|nr:CRISPR-associated protein Csn2-St [Streptococcus marimammalium]